MNVVGYDTIQTCRDERMYNLVRCCDISHTKHKMERRILVPHLRCDIYFQKGIVFKLIRRVVDDTFDMS